MRAIVVRLPTHCSGGFPDVLFGHVCVRRLNCLHNFPRRCPHGKDHLARHQLVLWGSPRNNWCYGDESFVGVLKHLAAASHHPMTLEEVARDSEVCSDQFNVCVAGTVNTEAVSQ